MSKIFQATPFLLAGMLALAACSSGPLRSFNAGDELAKYDFSESRTFEEGAYTDATLRIVDGLYRITLNRGDSEVWWAQWGDTLGDVVLDVDIEQVSERNENAYGVACRLRGQVGQETVVDPALAAIASGQRLESEATEEVVVSDTSDSSNATVAETTATSGPDEAEAEATESVAMEETAEADLANGDGYLFLIRGEGTYAIMRAHERNITPLVNWTESGVIHQGPGRNQMRAVCMGDYLALYINGEFVADATDDTYASGQIGLAASASNRLGVQVEFDNLVARKAVSG